MDVDADISSIGRQLDAVRTKHAVLTSHITELQAGFLELKVVQAAIRAELIANTTITAEIKDILTAGKVGTKMLKWMAIIAGSIAAIWAAVNSIVNPK
jgi:hypothetical protein